MRLSISLNCVASRRNPSIFQAHVRRKLKVLRAPGLPSDRTIQIAAALHEPQSKEGPTPSPTYGRAFPREPPLRLP